VSLLGALGELLSDARTSYSGRSGEPNSPPVGAIVVVFSGDPCCTVACAGVVECALAYAKVCLLYRVTRHVTLT